MSANSSPALLLSREGVWLRFVEGRLLKWHPTLFIAPFCVLIQVQSVLRFQKKSLNVPPLLRRIELSLPALYKFS
jgi:hypothetical protein